jgi:hypothetical protein
LYSATAARLYESRIKSKNNKNNGARNLRTGSEATTYPTPLVSETPTTRDRYKSAGGCLGGEHRGPQHKDCLFRCFQHPPLVHHVAPGRFFWWHASGKQGSQSTASIALVCVLAISWLIHCRTSYPNSLGYGTAAISEEHAWR